MSLFKTVNKYERESKQSVELKQKLNQHEAGYQEAQKTYALGVPECERIAGEIIATQVAGGSIQKLKDLAEEMKKAKAKRDGPLHNFKIIQNEIQVELERTVGPYIREKAEEWQAELTKVVRIFKEKSHTTDLEGKETYIVQTNEEMVGVWKEKLLASLFKLRSMFSKDIPTIEKFIEETETELKKIDLTAEVEIGEMSEQTFKDGCENLQVAPLKTVNAYPVGDGKFVIPEPPKSELDARFDRLKNKVGFRL